nr:hypothetical protein [Burkholderia cenocepacia]
MRAGCTRTVPRDTVPSDTAGVWKPGRLMPGGGTCDGRIGEVAGARPSARTGSTGTTTLAAAHAPASAAPVTVRTLQRRA